MRGTLGPSPLRFPTISPPIFAAASLALCLAACDEPAKPTASAASATATATQTAPPPPRPKTMPMLIVDAQGPYLGGTRIDMTNAAAGRERLAKVIADLPIEGKPVTLQAEKKAKTPDVAAVVKALGEAGAPKVTIQTDGRNDVAKSIDVTPPGAVSSPAACSVTTMVLKDLSTAVWSVQGGVAKRHAKGFAGPDLSHAGEALTKALAACDSTTAFVSADDSIGWEMTYNLAGTVLTSDAKKKLDTLVLLPEAPVAGRPVSVGK